MAFENIDLILAKHGDIGKQIVNGLCLYKSYSGSNRKFIVTAREYNDILRKFLNKNQVGESMLVIGDHMEAAIYARTIIQIKFATQESKLDKLVGKKLPIILRRNNWLCQEGINLGINIVLTNFYVESIKDVNIYLERTIVVCHNFEEAGKVAKHLDANKIPHELVKNIDTACEYRK